MTHSTGSWAEFAPRVGLCLAAALAWVAPHYWGVGATHARGSGSACVVLLAGAVLTLLLAALCEAPELPRRKAFPPGPAAMLALASAFLAVEPVAGYSPRWALALGALGWGLLAALRPREACSAEWNTGDLRWLLRTARSGVIVGLVVVVTFTRWPDGFGGLQHAARSARDWPAPSTKRDLLLGAGLLILAMRLPVPRFSRKLAYAPYLLVIGLQGEALRRLNEDPSLVETLRSAPLLAGVLGLVVS